MTLTPPPPPPPPPPLWRIPGSTPVLTAYLRIRRVNEHSIFVLVLVSSLYRTFDPGLACVWFGYWKGNRHIVYDPGHHSCHPRCVHLWNMAENKLVCCVAGLIDVMGEMLGSMLPRMLFLMCFEMWNTFSMCCIPSILCIQHEIYW